MKATLWKLFKWTIGFFPDRVRLAFLERPILMASDMNGIGICVQSSEEYYMRSKSAAKEPETVAWIDTIPEGGVLFDIGANVGMYSLYAGKRKLRVVAIEPHPASYASLCRNIQLNFLEPYVLPLSVAVSTCSAFMPLQYSNWQAGAAFHKNHPLQARLDSIVRTIRLTPTHLKIDVDGSELDVLQGATKTLESVQSIMIEIEDCNRPGCEKFLNAAGFYSQVAWQTGNPTMWNHMFDRRMSSTTTTSGDGGWYYST